MSGSSETRVNSESRIKPWNGRIAVVIHIYYLDLAEEIIDYLKNIPMNFDLFISCKKSARQEIQKMVREAFPQKNITIHEVENKGFDIAPFLIEFKEQLMFYDVVCKLHGKKSSHWKDTNIWRRYLFNNLVGDPAIIREIVAEFQKNSSLGLVFPDNYPSLEKWLGWENNYQTATSLFDRYGIRWAEDLFFDFPAGCMFWFRPQALKPLFDSGFTYEQFGSAPRTDGMLAHAIERIPLFVVKKEGYTWKKVIFSFGGEKSQNTPLLTLNPYTWKKVIFGFGGEKSQNTPCSTPNSIKKITNFGRIAVIIHLYYVDLLDELVFYLKNIPCQFDVFISMPSGNKEMTRNLIGKHFPDAYCEIAEVENVGFDIYPFTCLFSSRYKDYNFILKIHGKKSDYNPLLSTWREDLLKKLLGSQHRVFEILKEFQDNPHLGLQYPDYYPPIQKNIEWGSNFDIAQKLLSKRKIVLNKREKLDFPAGSMFWFRPESLSILFGLQLQKEDFISQNDRAIDGTLAHAIERIIGIVVEKNNYSWKKL